MHMRNALGYVANKKEIIEELEVVSLIGMHAVELAAPIPQQALPERERSA